MLKTATKSYTRNIYSEFEEEFKQQFFVSCKLLQSKGTIMTYTVIPMKFQDEATVVFNSKDMTITCSCKKYECTGLLCKHALRVFNINEVFILPPQYITSRWTKYAKNGFYCEKKQINENETLKMQAAHISRKATSVALKRSISKELLDEYEKAIDKLDREADEAISQRSEKVSGVSESANDDIGDVLKGKVSIRVPEVIKGEDPKDATNETQVGQNPSQFTAYFPSSIGANIP
ncbi:protein FAR1-RELATED SEQUENCE 9-like [Miscanthus floridulus]|uniref:protein FAR1-RELATED SEQUENCE 9-like n=1 Tax=Miscanthus floridulus TaxID=154761 RepID=UPI0034586543